MRALIVGLALVASGAAVADQSDFPMVDVEANCRRSEVNLALKACINGEQWAYDQLHLYWSALTQEDREFVAFSVGTSRGPSRNSPAFYRTLEQIAAGRLAVRQFKDAQKEPVPRFRY